MICLYSPKDFVLNKEYSTWYIEDAENSSAKKWIFFAHLKSLCRNFDSFNSIFVLVMVIVSYKPNKHLRSQILDKDGSLNTYLCFLSIHKLQWNDSKGYFVFISRHKLSSWGYWELRTMQQHFASWEISGLEVNNKHIRKINPKLSVGKDNK